MLRKHRKDAKHQQYQIDFLQEAVKSWRDRVADMTQKLQGAMNEKEALSKEKAELQRELDLCQSKLLDVAQEELAPAVTERNVNEVTTAPRTMFLSLDCVLTPIALCVAGGGAERGAGRADAGARDGPTDRGGRRDRRHR
mgnify:CR=1 FL=1